jgi:hypothetical protein
LSLASALILAAVAVSCGVGRENQPTESQTIQIPGVVVDHSPASSGVYLGSPGIAVLPGGEYLAKCDEFGPGSTQDESAVTRILRSRDGGVTWVREADLTDLFWASLFVHRGNVYLMGTTRQNGFGVILRSIDGGHSWTHPIDARTGLLLSDGSYHCAPVPVVVHGGRLWRAMEDTMGPDGWGSHFRALMMSIPEDADLLDAGNWTLSNRLGRNPEWLEGRFGGWLEGNAVAVPGNGVVNVLRVDYRPEGGKAALIRVSDDGTVASFNSETGFIALPGGCKKFTIRYDLASRLYWSLTNFIPPVEASENPERTRNTVALVASEDLRKWEVRSILLYHPDRQRHGFQYLDWQFEGDDIIAMSRTAFDDNEGGAHNQHDANYLTFHRFRDFRALTMADSVVPLDRLGLTP